MHLDNNLFSDPCHLLLYGILKLYPKQSLLEFSDLSKIICFGCSMNCFASIEGKFTNLWFSQNWDKFFISFFFHWFCNISTHISSKFLATWRLNIIMFRPLDKNDQKILLTLCTKFETLVAPSKLFSKLLKFCMVYFITKINKLWDEEVKNLQFDFSWITLIGNDRSIDVSSKGFGLCNDTTHSVSMPRDRLDLKTGTASILIKLDSKFGISLQRTKFGYCLDGILCLNSANLNF